VRVRRRWSVTIGLSGVVEEYPLGAIACLNPRYSRRMLKPELETRLADLGERVALQAATSRTLELFDGLLHSPDLLSLLDGYSDLTHLASISQLHPNSFVKIPIAVAPNGTKFVIHRWFDRVTSDRDLHNHRWNFVSAVLRGGLEAGNYVASQDPDGDFVEFAYRSATDQHAYPLEAVGRARLSLDGVESRDEGALYAQDHSIIHGAGASAAQTVTVIVQAPATVEVCRVFRPVGSGQIGKEMEHPSRDQVRTTLSEVRALLARRA
jgi:hypothetical protein